MSKKLQTDAPPTCPTFVRHPEKTQKALLDIFDRAIEMAEKAGLPEEEIFQFLEDTIDGRAVQEARAESERTGEKPIPLEKVIKDLGL